MWTLYACLMGIFRVGHVDPLCMFYEKYTELVMWTLCACLMKIFRVSHVDPFFASLMEIFRIGHVDPP